MKLSTQEFKNLVDSQGLDETIEYVKDNEYILTSKKLREAVDDYINAQEILEEVEDDLIGAQDRLETLIGLK